SEQDKKAAQDTSIYYFDTKLFWHDYAKRRREKFFYNYHQYQHEKKTIENNKRKPTLREMEQFKKIRLNNLFKQLNDDNGANYSNLNDNKENHIHTYREVQKTRKYK
ncbi:10518_t:CDS:1, partial [Gigaspora rosea]